MPAARDLRSTLPFVAAYLLLDWLTYADPLWGLNITPWNPEPALGLLFWLRRGRAAALPWFVALLLGEWLIRGLPAGPLWTLAGCAWLTLGYGLVGAALRRFVGGGPFGTGTALMRWAAVVAVGCLANAAVYVALLQAAGLVPPAAWAQAAWRFGIGDSVGVLVSMPLLWMVADAAGRRQLAETVWQRPAVRAETAGYLLLALCMLWAVFGMPAGDEFAHFYFLFLPAIWAASRQGVHGAAVIVFALQMAIVALRKWYGPAAMSVAEWQMLDAVLALVGFFIGSAVDERRRVADELKQTLRMAAAGDMAAALAHELSQPVTALGAYGRACQHLLEQDDAGERNALLRTALGRMIDESNRAAEVVRRLRDFFRSGATRLERVRADTLVAALVRQFRVPFHEHDVSLVQQVEPDAWLQADRVQIELVLRNLLANALDAVKAQPGGQRKVQVLARRTAPREFCVSVIDSGTGIDAALAARLFEPFATTKAAGMGLGLALSRAIVAAHGGRLWAEAGAQGAFHFTLPADEREEAP
ncbi:phospho-acceptor domain-containing protein [Pseudoduganella flava]|uniref:histidine kinase n=2 Tax=Pseudoduganella flava TaxID=871742 RepID=A0A562PVB7_9BURK|nr:GHKL domain-containing protein [Pseudoduganella flava]TWI48402.1 phospho-acceptor domain-containing protein [Pseudoduganella flava]